MGMHVHKYNNSVREWSETRNRYKKLSVRSLAEEEQQH